MPDFLNRLAARALGAFPVAEPIIPARFSPAAAQASLSPFEVSEEAALAAPETSPDFEHRAPHNDHRGDHSFESRPTYLAAPVRNGEGRSGPSDAEMLDASQPQESRRHAEPNTAEAPAPAAQRTLQPPIPAIPLAAQSSVPNPLNEAKGREMRMNATPAPTPFAEPKSGSGPTAPLILPDSTAGRPVPSAAATMASASPIIRVTIGRIEVRAETTSPPPARVPHRSRPSHVSLEQFLKQAGGSAR